MPEEYEFAHIKVTAKTSPDEVVYAGSSQASEEASEETSEETASQNFPTSERAAHRAKRYRETTLADLQDTKISLTQKSVIIAAILLIIVAVAYCIVVLR